MATRLVEILEEAGLPGGVLNLVTGSAAEAGDPLVKEPRVAGISFTGSTTAGRQIAEYCGKTLKRLGLELGGKNAIVVLDDADVPLAQANRLLARSEMVRTGTTLTSRAVRRAPGLNERSAT